MRPHGVIDMPAYKGDAGYDCYAMEDAYILPGENYKMPLGVALEFPNRYVCLVNQKSGNSIKFGFDTIGNVIDSNYRGEIHCIIANITKETIVITAGMKVCQLLFMPIVTSNFKYVNELSESDRSINGFGSSDKK